MSEIIIPKTKEEKQREAHKEWEIQYNRTRAKKWYQDNKGEKRAYSKEYRKEHYEENKGKINETSKKYHEQNKTKILEQAAAKITCEICGSMVCYRRMTDHKRTVKCKTLNEKKNEVI